MDSRYLVEAAISEGRKLWQALDPSTPVKCAFWTLPDRESASWSLNIASDHFSALNLSQEYADVLLLIQSLGLNHVSLAMVRLLHGGEPVVRDVINLRIPHAGEEPLWRPQAQLGGVEFAAAVLYPLPDRIPKTAEKVTVFADEEQEIVDQLAAHNIKVSVRRLGEQYYSCRARHDADQRDPQVTYGESVLEVLQRITQNVKSAWPDLLASTAS